MTYILVVELTLTLEVFELSFWFVELSLYSTMAHWSAQIWAASARSSSHVRVPKQSLPDSCWMFITFLPDSCLVFVRSLPDCCSMFVRLLPELCQTFASSLPEFCQMSSNLRSLRRSRIRVWLRRSVKPRIKSGLSYW